MMTCQKRKPTSDKNQVVTDGYKLGDTSADVTGECESLGGGKQQRMDSLRCRTTSTWLDEILTSLEEQRWENHQNHQENLASQSLRHMISSMSYATSSSVPLISRSTQAWHSWNSCTKPCRLHLCRAPNVLQCPLYQRKSYLHYLRHMRSCENIHGL